MGAMTSLAAELEQAVISERYVRGKTGYEIPKPGQVGPRQKPMPIPGMPSGDFILSMDVVRRLRKDFLTLVGNVNRVKTTEEMMKLRKAVLRWAAMLSNFGYQMRQDFEAKRRGFEAQSKKAGVPRDPTGAANAQWHADHMKDWWRFQQEMRDIPGMNVAYARKYNPNVTLDDIFVDFKIKGPKWEKRVRRKAQVAWKWLEMIVGWARENEWSGGGGGEPVGLKLLTHEKEVIGGFAVEIVGFREQSEFDREALEQLKAGLDFYARRARRVFPWLITHKLPFVAYFQKDMGGDWSAAASWDRDHINLYPLGLHTGGELKEAAHIFAHEMGHHLWHAVLSGKQQDAWSALVKGSQVTVDLRDWVKLWKPGEGFLAFEKRMRLENPVISLQLDTLYYDRRYQHTALQMPDEASVQRYIDTEIATGRQPTITITSKPITAYAAKNTQEAFCEALGMLVGYGPRVLLPEVRRWLNAIVPDVKIEQADPLVDELAHILEAMAGQYKVLSPRELERKLSPRRRSDEIDQEWIDGIRKGWKQLAAEVKNYEGRNRDYGAEPTKENVVEAWDAAVRALERVRRYVNDLRSTILITKGFWQSHGITPEKGTKEPRGAKKKRSRPGIERPYAKTVDEVNAAVDVAEFEVGDIKSKARYFADDSKYGFWEGSYAWNKADEERRKGYLKVMANEPPGEVDKVIKKLDGIISGRLLRHLTTLVKSLGWNGKLNTGSHDAPVVHVGKFTIIFGDIPDDPRKVAADVDKPDPLTSTDPKVWDKKAGFHSPADRERLARALQNTTKMLQRRKLGFVAYGKVKTVIQGLGVVIHPDPKKGGAKMQAAATYHRGGDFIQTYMGGKSYMSWIFIHELGHRYWYKFLSQGDRQRFKQFFGKTASTSEYGESNPAEDFAELFTSYVLYPATARGFRKMTKDQYQRMQAFLGRTRKLEMMTMALVLSDQLIEAVAVVKRTSRAVASG